MLYWLKKLSLSTAFDFKPLIGHVFSHQSQSVVPINTLPLCQIYGTRVTKCSLTVRRMCRNESLLLRDVFVLTRCRFNFLRGQCWFYILHKEQPLSVNAGYSRRIQYVAFKQRVERSKTASHTAPPHTHLSYRSSADYDQEHALSDGQTEGG